MTQIKEITAREIYDSRGVPTVEADVYLEDGSMGRAAVPSGASTGMYEAIELRDGDAKRLGGKGVTKAIGHIREIIFPALKNTQAAQSIVDAKLIALDGTPNKSKLGANAILAVSLAVAKALAQSQKQPLWEYFRSLSQTNPVEYVMPVPLINMVNGGKHAEHSSDIQEFMIVPQKAASFAHALEMGAQVFMTFRTILSEKGLPTSVGDEGGFALPLESNTQPLELLVEAITRAGYVPGTDISLALDVAASELFRDGKYHLRVEGAQLTAAELGQMYSGWIEKFPIVSLEDGFEQNAWQDFQTFTKKHGQQIQIVGDDLFATNQERLQKGIFEHAATAILIKFNQIGTVTETVSAVDLARKNGLTAIISHRSGETEDTSIADFVVGLSTGQIKTGSLSRSERVAKYNQLLRIEEALGQKAIYSRSFIARG